MEVPNALSCTKESVSREVLTTLYLPKPEHKPQTQTPAEDNSTPHRHTCPAHKPYTPTPLLLPNPLSNGPKTAHKLTLTLTRKYANFYEFALYAPSMLLTHSHSHETRLHRFFLHSHSFFTSRGIALTSIEVRGRDLDLYFASDTAACKADDTLWEYCERCAGGEMWYYHQRKLVIRDVPKIEGLSSGIGGWRELDHGYLGALREMNQLGCGRDYRVLKVECWAGRGWRSEGGDVWVVTFRERFAAEGFLEKGLDLFGFRGGVVGRWVEDGGRWGSGWDRVEKVEADSACEKGLYEGDERKIERQVKRKPKSAKSVQTAPKTKPKAIPGSNVNRFEALGPEE